MSHIDISQLKFKDVWICEFCGTRNEVEITKQEVSSEEEVTYLITPPSTPSWSSQVGAKLSFSEGDDEFIVFCIDTSGSMSVTTEVRSKNVYQFCSIYCSS